MYCVQLSVHPTDVNVGHVKADVVLSGDGMCSVIPTAQKSLVVALVRDPQLTVATTHTLELGTDAVLNAKDIIAYTVTVTNSGNVDLTTVRITDVDLPGFVCTYEGTLLVGATVTCPHNYEIQQSDIDATVKHNTANATATPPADMTDITASSPTSVDLIAAKALTVTTSGVLTTGSVSEPVVNDVITWSINIVNSGETTLKLTDIVDLLVDEDNTNTVLTCEVTKLPTAFAPDAQIINCSATSSVTQTDLDNGKVVNTACVYAADTLGVALPTPYCSDATVLLTQVRELSISKKVSGVTASPAVGDIIKYSLEAVNSGNTVLYNVAVSDTMSAALLNANPSGCKTATLVVQAKLVCNEYSYTLTQQDVDAGWVYNEARATAPTVPASESSVAKLNTTLPSTPALELTLTALLSPAQDSIRYTFTVFNPSTVTMSHVTIHDPLLETAGKAINCPPTTMAAIAPHTTVVCYADYPVDVILLNKDTLSNIACVSGTDPHGTVVAAAEVSVNSKPLCSQAVVEFTHTPAITVKQTVLVVDENGDGSTQQNEQLCYTLTVTNTGNMNLNNLVLQANTFDVPMTTAAFAVAQQCTNYAATDTMCCNIATVGQPSTSYIFGPVSSFKCYGCHQITLAEVNAESSSNTATVTAQDMTAATTPVTDSAVLTTHLTVVAGIDIDVTSLYNGDVNQVKMSDTITYTFTISNTGSNTLHDVTAVDTLKQLVTGTTVCNNNQILGSIVLLPGSSPIVCTVIYSITASEVRVLLTTATKATYKPQLYYFIFEFVFICMHRMLFLMIC
jgi:uncharacterized repeat protein (TIGR01451 family)